MNTKSIRHMLKILNDLIEFRTSIAIVLSCFLGSFYSLYATGQFRLDLFLIMVIIAVLLDGAATVFNNYFDYKKAKEKDSYLYNVHNPIVYHKLDPKFALLTGALLVILSSFLGLYLLLKTSWLLLLVGGASILTAYLYSGGPYPISYTPLGELTSGFFEGFIVFNTAFFINSGAVSLQSVMVSLLVTFSISNIMLANNLCDVEEDLKNGRKTLPIVIGVDRGIHLLYSSHFAMIFLGLYYVVIGYMPLTSLGVVLTLPFMVRHLNTFSANMTKAQGFVYVLKNTLLFNFVLLLTWILAIVINL